MPRLDNPKHEAYAIGLSKGMKQLEAYAHAGYTPNPSAASRLSVTPTIADRVDELKEEVKAQMSLALTATEAGDYESLAEMGISIEWVAAQYRQIYVQAMDVNSLAAANSAISNIQRLLELEKNEGKGPVEDTGPAIKINDVTGMLTALKELAQLSQKEGDEPLPMIDVTPSAILATQALADNDDYS